MKKMIARSSMMAVAVCSLLLGGVSNTAEITESTGKTGVRDTVDETPIVIGQAVANGKIGLADAFRVNSYTKLLVAPQQEGDQVLADVQQEQAKVQEAVKVEEKKAKVESDQVVARIDSYLNIRKEASEEAEVVGKFYTGNVGTVIEKGEEWSLVSSGNAYGYVNNDYLLFGDDAEGYIESNCDQVAKVTAETLNVRAEESTDSDVVSLSDVGDVLTVLGLEGNWIKVAVTDEEVGYVSSDYVYVDYVYETAVTIEEEEAALAAQAEQEAAELAIQQAQEEEETQEVQQAENISQSEKQVVETPSTEAPKAEEPKQEKKSEETASSGQEIADYAVQFVGNPYVYGGTSLTNGADCSGFVQSVYKHFGYSLSRTAASQAGDGTTVSVDSLQPGDLLFYHGFGHVAIYIGGGQVVHASNASSGIKISTYNYSPIDKAVRIIP